MNIDLNQRQRELLREAVMTKVCKNTAMIGEVRKGPASVHRDGFIEALVGESRELQALYQELK